jgi:hypothetical protein
MELLSWIDPTKLNTDWLNENENALEYLNKHKNLIRLRHIVTNPSFKILVMENDLIHSLFSLYPTLFSNPQPGIETYIRTLDYTTQHWYYICKNPECINLIIENPKNYEYNWRIISGNCKAVQFLLQHFDKIDWDRLSANQSPEAIKLLLQYPQNINLPAFSTNPFATDYLRLHFEKIDFWGLSWNYNAVDIIEKNLHRDICWVGLSQNKNAIHLLEKNQHKINWTQLSTNPAIFQYNYSKLALQRTNVLREELMMKTLHPKRIQYWLENGMDMDDLPE